MELQFGRTGHFEKEYLRVDLEFKVLCLRYVITFLQNSNSFVFLGWGISYLQLWKTKSV